MVNMICVVRSCRKESYPGCGLSFHRLPANNEVRKKWSEVIPGKLTNSAVICSVHFKADDYLTEARKKLKSGVVPSIFPENDCGVVLINQDPLMQECSPPSSPSGDIIMIGDPSEESEEEPFIQCPVAQFYEKGIQTDAYIGPKEESLKQEVKNMQMKLNRYSIKINILKQQVKLGKEREQKLAERLQESVAPMS